MSDQNSDPSRPFDPPVPPTAPPAPPVAPPAPPVAPEPQRPDVPQYGEYAAVDPSNPYGVPGYPAASAAAPVAPTAPAVPPYGTPAYGTPGYGAPAYAPPVRKRRTWDVVLTCILLVLGLIGMSLGLLYAWAFSNPDILSGALAQQGLTGNLTPGAAPAVIAISHIVLYFLAVGLSIFLMIRGKVVVFWIPLVIGVVAAIIFWVSLGIVISSDSTLLNSYVGGS
ncbi:MAG: DUF6264 family protein, partial [Pseudolysinimonas sp.]